MPSNCTYLRFNTGAWPNMNQRSLLDTTLLPLCSFWSTFAFQKNLKNLVKSSVPQAKPRVITALMTVVPDLEKNIFRKEIQNGLALTVQNNKNHNVFQCMSKSFFNWVQQVNKIFILKFWNQLEFYISKSTNERAGNFPSDQ